MKKLSETLRSSLSNLMPLSNNEKIEILHHIDKQENEIKRLNNIINELEKSWKEEITRFNNFIQEDSSLIEINNIRQMLIQEREKDLYKLRELKGVDKE